MSFTNAFSQKIADVTAQRLIVYGNFYFKDYWLIGVQRDSGLIDPQKFPTSLAVRNFVEGRIATYAATHTSGSGTSTRTNADSLGLIPANQYLLKLGDGSGLTGLTKTQVGLSNVDNTSDINKPISTIQQTALNLKLSYLDSSNLFKDYRDSIFRIKTMLATVQPANISILSANGFAGTANSSNVITLSTTINGMVKGLGGSFYTANAGTDYTTPSSTETVTNKNFTSGTNIFPIFNQNTTGTASNITSVLNAISFPALNGDVLTSPGNLNTTISSGAVSLSKMANVSTGTIFYRKTANTGSPEVQPLSTLKTDLGLSGTNSGDDAINALYSGLVSNANHTGDVVGSTSTVVKGINGVLLANLTTGLIKNTAGTPSTALPGTDYLLPNGSAAGLTSFPTLNQNTTGTALNVTGTVSITNGGTGATTSTGALTALLPSQTSQAGKFLSTDGTTPIWSTAGTGDMTLAAIQLITGAKTFSSGKLLFAGLTSGTISLNAPSVAGTGIVTLPLTGTLSTLAGFETITNKDFTSGSNAFPIFNQNTTGTSGNVSGVVGYANGGTGATSAVAAITGLLPSQASQTGKFLTTNGTSLSWSSAGTGDMSLASIQTITGAKTFNSGKLVLGGSTSGVTTLNAPATATSGIVTLPQAGTLATLDGAELFTNKTFGAGNTYPTFNQNTTGTATTITGNINENQVLNLQSDLGLKANLASPVFSGTPLVPLAVFGNRSQQAASTQFVQIAIDSLKKDSIDIATTSQPILQVTQMPWGTDAIGFKQQLPNKLLLSGPTPGAGATDMSIRSMVMADLPFTLGSGLFLNANVLSSIGGVGSSDTSTFYGTKTFVTQASTEAPTFGTEIFSGFTSTGWTGSLGSGFTHTAGNTSSLISSVSLVSSSIYRFSITVSGSTTGSILITGGGLYNTYATNTSDNTDFRSLTSNAIQIAPTSDFNGTIIISLKGIIATTPAYVYKSSNGTVIREIRMNTLNNVFDGIGSGRVSTTAHDNYSAGPSAGGVITTAQGNVNVGSHAAELLDRGNNSVNAGIYAGSSGYVASDNVVVGAYANTNNTYGGTSVILGSHAAELISTSAIANVVDHAIMIGANTKPLANSDVNETVIGIGTSGRGSNTSTIGTTATTSSKLFGVLNIGTVPNYLNNAAALTAGLVIGDVYRNGDILQVVH